MTNTVLPADGTSIAYDLLGSGPPAIVVGGATCDRARTADTAAAPADQSSGAALVLRALAAGLPITRAVLHEPPYGPESAAGSACSYRASLLELLEAGRRDDALALFFTITAES